MPAEYNETLLQLRDKEIYLYRKKGGQGLGSQWVAMFHNTKVGFPLSCTRVNPEYFYSFISLNFLWIRA